MSTRHKSMFAALFALLGLGTGSKSTEAQILEYLAFYYPSNNDARYEISFDWGTYDIYTTASSGDNTSDGRYIVARPTVDHVTPGDLYWTYLVTPAGTVWRRLDGGNIPTSGQRKTVTVSHQDNATTTATITIDSPAEPVIDDFLRQPEAWSKYGVLVD